MASTHAKINRILERISCGEGIRSTELPGLRTILCHRNVPRSSVLYEPSIVFVTSGSKRGHVGIRSFVYDTENYLVLAAPLPFDCETFCAPEAPMRGISILLDMAVLADLVLKLPSSPPQPVARTVDATPLPAELAEALLRLLEAYENPNDRMILGPQIIREITYRVLTGPRGQVLRDLLAMQGSICQIYRAMHRIQTEFDRQLDIPTLAADAGMSLSAFHQHFRNMTATSPLQYLKVTRLHKARLMMIQEGIGASVAASRVGYESPSQFSREFKRLFGVSPAEESQRLRSHLGAQAQTPLHVAMI
ncbi:AraC family transcriptional regulator [Terriglobus tenax]|uniref:AraC family transcriptional regulator n=1 Tax=Terriglobus tenax TaxID=1111115 RepID=UPI0021E011FD|nr:AraC family transcriptional regulator [Terriglobus tenax]